jgi:nucleoside-diphosphate-sugar epimerase
MASSPTIYAPYAMHDYLPIDEDSKQGPLSIYGAAKQNLESLARNYARWQGMAIAALRTQRIVYEGSYEWRLHQYTVDDSAAVENLWAYIDARDVATACLAWVDADHQGFEVFNVAADDVCVDTPTRDLLDKHYPAMPLRGEVDGRLGLINCRKIKRMLGWQPQHTWQTIADESQSMNSLAEATR